MMDQIIISSYEPPSIYEVKKLDPTLPTSLRLGGRISWTKELVRHADAVNLNQHVIDRNRVDAIHRHGLLLNVWTVNDPLIMERLAREGVDAIFTDRPDIPIGVLKALQ